MMAINCNATNTTPIVVVLLDINQMSTLENYHMVETKISYGSLTFLTCHMIFAHEFFIYSQSLF